MIEGCSSHMERIIEGNTSIMIKPSDKVSRKMHVFYNPVMKLNRDLSVLVLDALGNNGMQIGLPLAGSGIRGLRFLDELGQDMIRSIHLNDHDPDAVENIRNNLRINGLDKDSRVVVECKDADEFLLSSKGFDYIDIDPFGSPNPYLDSAVKRISRNGIIAVTATDTAPLCGTYKRACQRKYWAYPRHGAQMHEYGLRILIRKVQLMGSQYDKALYPLFSYSKDHYMRIFFRAVKGKEKCDCIIREHIMADEYGPLWSGKLNDTELLEKMHKKAIDKKIRDLLETLVQETRFKGLGFVNIHLFCKSHKIDVPRTDVLVDSLKSKGFFASRTHFDRLGLKTDATEKELKKIICGL